MLGWTVALLVTVLDMFRKIISLNKENYWFKSLYFSSFCIPILLLVSLVTKNEYIFFLPLFWTSIPLAHVFGWIHLYESGGWFPDIQPLGYLVWYLSFVVLGLIIGLACDYFIRKKHGYQLLILTSSVLVLSLYVLYALTTLPPTKCHFVFEGKYMDNRTSCYLEVLRIDESLATTDFCNTKLKPHPENSESVHNYFSCLLIVARNTGDTEICTQIATFESKFSSEDEYIECIGSLARNEHETSRCSQFDEDWVAFRQCLESVNDNILTTNACTKFTVPWQHDMSL